MQTFLPYPDFAAAAAVLDRRRLGKQRVEVLQLLAALTGERPGWRNHPAAAMWRGHEVSLRGYGVAVCREWLERGYRDGCLARLEALDLQPGGHPSWLGDERFHAAHRAVLLAKDPVWYGQWGWRETPAVMVDGSWPYVWPGSG